MRIVVLHAALLLVLGSDETQLHHQLTAVADTQRKGVLTGIEAVDGLLGLGAEEDSTCPSLG